MKDKWTVYEPLKKIIMEKTDLEIFDDKKECAFIELRGATQRLLMIMNAQSERNYEAAFEAVKRAFRKYMEMSL